MIMRMTAEEVAWLLECADAELPEDDIAAVWGPEADAELANQQEEDS